jgi:predicted phage terminase large subunit-like protein
MITAAMLPTLAQIKQEKARRDLVDYAKLCWPIYRVGRHHHIIAEALARVEQGKCKRLMIFAPPRHGKSMLTSEFFPAWYMGRNPDKYVMHATYSQELAEDWGRKIRNQLADPEYPFKNCSLSTDSASQKKFSTNQGGTYFALGVGGAATGRGAHLLLIDDPLKNREEADSETIREKLKGWYRSVAYTRLMPGGSIVIIQTRWHEDDLSGWLLREHADENWEVLSLPAIAEDGDCMDRKPGEALWPSDYNEEALEKIKQQLGSRDWSALYQQRPSPDGGSIFKLDWFRRYNAIPANRSLRIHSWDTAAKDKEFNDPTAFGLWDSADSGYYLSDVMCSRMQFPELRRAVESLACRDNPDAILIEDKSSGQQLIQVLRQETRLPVIAIEPVISKLARAQGISGTIESGRVFLPNIAPWLVDYESEIKAFPVGVHDDMVDMTSQALRYLIDNDRPNRKKNDEAWKKIPTAGGM